MPDDLDIIFKALSDPTRRRILDLLRDRPRTTGDIVSAFPKLSRFGVMKHLDVLKSANLVLTQPNGRERINSLNAAPIRMIYERWVGNFTELWSKNLLEMMRRAEGDDTPKS